MNIIASMRSSWLKCIPGIVLFSLGMGIGWWFNRPIPPWMEFIGLTAFYETGGLKIDTEGQYIVQRECIPAPWHPSSIATPVWRYETIASSGEVLVYGPKPVVPPLSLGEHQYNGTIPIVKPIDPEGWAVRVLITCPGEVPETVTAIAPQLQVRSMELEK